MPVAVFIVIPIMPTKMPNLQTIVVIMIERGCCATEKELYSKLGLIFLFEYIFWVLSSLFIYDLMHTLMSDYVHRYVPFLLNSASHICGTNDQ